MPKPDMWLRAIWLAAVLASPVESSAIRLDDLFMRDVATCGLKGFISCKQSGLPDNFCCKSNDDCIVLAAETTVLCCPEGGDCGRISAITCDIALQDPSKFPDAQVKTTALNVKLPKCGDNTCCPFGYHCDGGNQCVVDTDQNTAPGAGTTDPDPSGSSTTKPSDPTSTADPTETEAPTDPANQPTAEPTDPTQQPTGGNTSGGATAPTGAPSTLEPPKSSPDKGPQTAAIVGGVVAAVVIIVLIIAAFVVIRHRRKQQLNNDGNSSTSSFGNSASPATRNFDISNPMPIPDKPNARADFINAGKAHSFSSSSAPTVTNNDYYAPGQEKDQGVEPPTPNGSYQPYSFRRDSQVSRLSNQFLADHDAEYVQRRPHVPTTPGGRSHHASAEIRSLTTSGSTNNRGRMAPTPTGRREDGYDFGGYDDDDEEVYPRPGPGHGQGHGLPEITVSRSASAPHRPGGGGGGGGGIDLLPIPGFMGQDNQGNRDTQWTNFCPPETPATATATGNNGPPQIPAYIINTSAPQTPSMASDMGGPKTPGRGPGPDWV